jgi:hypothetical protein
MKVLPLILGAPLAVQAGTIRKCCLNAMEWLRSNHIAEKRQDGLSGLLSGALSYFMQDMKPYKIEQGTSGMKREGVKNIRIYHGPLKLLPASEVGISSLNRPNMLIFQGRQSQGYEVRPQQQLLDGRLARIPTEYIYSKNKLNSSI